MTCLIIQYNCLLCGFCSSGQCFAFGFLQIPPHGGHPCRPLMIPLTGLIGDLHSQVSAPCRAHTKQGFTILPVNPCFYRAEGETRTLTEFNPNRILSPKSDSVHNFNIYNITSLFINKLTPPNRHKSTPFNTNYQPQFTLKLSRIGHVKYRV